MMPKAAPPDKTHGGFPLTVPLPVCTERSAKGGEAIADHRPLDGQGSQCCLPPLVVAVGPRFPESYTMHHFHVHTAIVAVGPRFPESYTTLTDLALLHLVAVGPRFPESYTMLEFEAQDVIVAVGPRFPESYTRGPAGTVRRRVAVGPRFPESYTMRITA